MSPYGDEGPESEFDRHEGDTDWGDRGDDLYEDMLNHFIEDYGAGVMDQHAAELLYDGWFDRDVDAVARAEAWYEFFEYTGIEYDDFYWEDWRDWYES
jgi:hypothetical protein